MRYDETAIPDGEFEAGAETEPVIEEVDLFTFQKDAR